AAQGYWWFLVAVLFNNMWRVSGNSFTCLMVEDGDDEKLIHTYTILSLIGLVVGFFSPLIGLSIERFSLVLTMRVIYLASAVLMCAKYVLQYGMLRETTVGAIRMNECRDRSLMTLTFGGWSAFTSAIRQPRLLLLVVLMALMNCFNTVQATFWPLFVTTAYHVQDTTLTLFPPVKALATAAAYLFITPRISLYAVRRPMLVGLIAQALGLAALLICLPLGSAALAAVFFSAVCDAFSLAVLSPMCESLLSVTIPSQERARVYSLIIATVLLISMPIGWIAGRLSQENRTFPLILNLCLLAAEAVLALRVARSQRRDTSAAGSVSD
ncbi:MAG TPA: hypothetical protein VN540_07720, partial [Clostridia bacterium]|nr:hypothetical protein [Clostridia bacterium]